MSDLRETLATLSAAVPQVPGHVSAVAAQGEQLKQAVAALMSAIEARRSDAEQLLGHLREALDAVKEDADKEVAEVDAALGVTETATDQTVAAVEEEAGHVGETAGAAHGALEALQNQFRGAAEAVGHAQEQAAAALGGVATALHEGQQTLAEAAHEAAAEGHAAQEAVHQAQQQLLAASDALRARADDLLARAQARVGETLAQLHALRSSHAEALEQASHQLEARSAALVADLQRRGHEEVEQRVQQGVREAVDGLVQLGQDLDKARVAAEHAREAVHEAVLGLGEAMEPVPATIDAVRGAASQFNLPWS